MATPRLYIKNKKGNLSATFTDTVNANLQGTQGPAVVGDRNSVNVVNNTLDGGAIEQSARLAERIGTRAFDFADETAARSITLAGDVNRRSLDEVAAFGRAALDTVAAVTTGATSAAAQASKAALDFAFNATKPESQAVGQDAVKALKWAALATAAVFAIRGLK